MTTDQLPIRKPRMWLIIGAVLAALGTAILWPLQQVGQVCILIYPAPPGCGSPIPPVAPLVGIGVLIVLLAVMFIVYFTRPEPRRVLVVLAVAMIAVIGLTWAVVWLSQTGIWDPYQPPVVID
jgi:hypothetical protein